MAHSQLEYWSNPKHVAMANEWFHLAPKEHFWMEWRFQTLLRHRHLLPVDSPENALMDVGCGHGAFLEQIQEHFSYSLIGCDLNLAALQASTVQRARIAVYDITERKPELQGRFAVACLMDVIEHIDDDVEFLRATSFHVQPGGIMVINVPAGPFLFSKYDTVQGHRRRYTKQTLLAAIESAGLHCEALTPWAAWMIPVLLLRKVIMLATPEEKVMRTGFSAPSPLAERMFRACMRQELAMTDPPQAGTSLMAFARVPKKV